MGQDLKNIKIAIVGLGYVGLPLAVEFSRQFSVVGLDINTKRVQELNNGKDHTLEVDEEQLRKVTMESFSKERGLYCTSRIEDAAHCNVFIITVPTPTNKYNNPDLTPLIEASKSVSTVLSRGDVVVYESTVYPGVTEEICVPVIEKISGLKFNKDFYCGYSPERINPGDKQHTVTNIKKVTSGSTPEIAVFVDELYKTIITAGTHKATSIKVAEAAKVIENAQRDINIAFVNELAKIFNLLQIDTREVLDAASTKWNFLPFSPGLVGGHCIGVDPYYLAQKAQEVGYHPEIILAGRRLNDGMGGYVASEVAKLMIKKDIRINGGNALLLGFTFKENCPDIRNTRVIDIYYSLKDYGLKVDVYDPWANSQEVLKEYGLNLISNLSNNYQCIVLAVSHNEFLNLDLEQLKSSTSIVYDVKGVLEKSKVDGRL